MAKEETKKDERSEKWGVLLAEYEKRNPKKFAAKKAAGQFDKIPANFK